MDGWIGLRDHMKECKDREIKWKKITDRIYDSAVVCQM